MLQSSKFHPTNLLKLFANSVIPLYSAFFIVIIIASLKQGFVSVLVFVAWNKDWQ